MKFKSLLLSTLILVMLSCEESSLDVEQTPDPEVKTLISKIDGLDLTSSSLRNNEQFSNRFDFENPYEVHLSSNSNKAIYLNGSSNHENDKVQYGLIIGYDDQLLDTPVEVKTTIIKEKIYEISYYREGFLLYSAVVNANNPNNVQLVKEGNFRNVRVKDRPCGQDVMDCISDVYTEQGGLSVWAWVQTAFIPATAVAVGWACAIHNC
jgi:hypothetical protein